MIGAKATFSAAHSLPQHPELHGHSYVVWAFTDTPKTDAEAWQIFLRETCAALDHKTLPPELATMESIAEFIGEATGSIKVQVIRPIEGLMAEWTKLSV